MATNDNSVWHRILLIPHASSPLHLPTQTTLIDCWLRVPLHDEGTEGTEGTEPYVTLSIDRGSTPNPTKIELDGDMVSKRHATLACSASGQVYIRDEGSTGGTILNSCTLEKGPRTSFTPLKDGTIIQFGLMYHHPQLGILRAPKFVVVLTPHMYEHYMEFLRQILPDTNVTPSPTGVPSTSTIFFHRMDLPRDCLPPLGAHHPTPTLQPPPPPAPTDPPVPNTWFSPCAGRNLFRARVIQAVQLDAVLEGSESTSGPQPIANARRRWRRVLGEFSQYTLVQDDVPAHSLFRPNASDTERWNLLRWDALKRVDQSERLNLIEGMNRCERLEMLRCFARLGLMVRRTC